MFAQEALNLSPADHPQRVPHLHTLAQSFQLRHQRLGDMSDLESALQKYQEILDLTPADSSLRARALLNLALSFGDRYQRLHDLPDLKAAMENSQTALGLIPTDHPLKRTILYHSASYFQQRYERLGDLIDLDNAIQKYKQSIELILASLSLEKARVLLGLAMALRDRYRRLADSNDLEAAIKTSNQTVKLIPMDHPLKPESLQCLASCLADRYQWLGKPKDLEHVQNLYITSFQTLTMASPQNSWDAALEWATFTKRYKPSYCLAAYMAAFDLLPDTLWIGHTISVRYSAIHRFNIGPVTASSTRICIQLLNLATGVQMMEQGVAIVFQQMLQLRPDVDTLPQKLAQEFQKLSSELYSASAEKRGTIAIQRGAILEKIRKRRGHQYFLLRKPYTILRQAAERGPVVMLNSHEDGCDGIIILNCTSEPVHVSLPSVTPDLLKSQREILKKLLDRCNVRTRDETVSTRLFGQREEFTTKSTQECFADLLTWLWENIVGPVFQVLVSHGIHNGRLWWLPTGSFAGLPLHASAPSDPFIHSYTATLGILLDAQARRSSRTQNKVGVVGITHTGPGRRHYLKGVEEEVKKICAVTQISSLQCLQGEQATPEAVKHQLRNCSWIHLACHGKQDVVEPTKSRLLLYNGDLELERILEMRLSNAEFVFLAACQTAMGDAVLVNESFHLGGGFIAAGFRSAVGTLWSMNDQDGPVVAENFYSHLFRNGQRPRVTDTAEALQNAVNKLRAMNVPYERWVPFIHMGI
ncbi:CHAT domain-containing protein [Mycena capillaripes]|nr:CHAT domain-containing protein [Mycena capillaripes]